MFNRSFGLICQIFFTATFAGFGDQSVISIRSDGPEIKERQIIQMKIADVVSERRNIVTDKL